MKKDILIKFIEDIIFYDPDSPYVRIENEVNRIDNDYFDDIQRDCEMLPTDLNPSLRDKVIAEFKRKISSLLTNDLLDNIVAEVKLNMTVSSKDIASLIERLRTHSYSFQRSIIGISPQDEEIEELYKNAKIRTLGERIMHSNKADVIRFHHALQDNTVCHVRQLVAVEMGKFLSTLANKLEHLKS